MSATRRVFVTNIPARSYIENHVEIPENTRPEGVNEAIRKALLERGLTGPGGVTGPVELDEQAIQDWEFDTPLEAS